MGGASLYFDDFRLDPAERLLTRAGAPVDLSGRYLDALVVLVGTPGKLVTKERFLEEVWHGVPVTDEALTQCIKALRRALGDDAARPRFIETVPKYGYRFITEVSAVGLKPAEPPAARPAAPVVAPMSLTGSAFLEAPPLYGFDWARYWLLAGAGVIGGGLAGVVGGLAYGFVAAGQSTQAGSSVVIVLTALTVLFSILGSAGICIGLAAVAQRRAGWAGYMAGGSMGGMIIGGSVKLLGLDAFSLLYGSAPATMTGGLEGVVIGAAVGLGLWFARETGPVRLWPAALIGLVVGAAIPALGGKLLGGSLFAVAQMFPQSQFRPDEIGALVGENGFGPVSGMVSGAIESLLFVGGVVWAMALARRQMDQRDGGLSKV
jgi:DNA-binding winged helix-turn-helix (wHTH) protein